MKLASLRIVTEDVASLASFYREITGVEPVGYDEFVELRTPVGALAICSRRSVDEYNAGAASAADNASVIVEFEVEDVDAERPRVETLVSALVQQPTDQPWGNRSMLFRDPDGNLINFFTRLGT